MDLSKFYNQFREETAENVRVLSDGLLALERLPNADDPQARSHIDAIFRAVHTIKGSSRLLGFTEIGRLAHTMEHILGMARDGRRTLDRATIDELLHGSDALLELAYAAVDGRPSGVHVDERIAVLEQLADRGDSPPMVSTEPDHTPEIVIVSPPAAEPPSAPLSPPSPAPVAPTPEPASIPTSPTSPVNARAFGLSDQTIRVRIDRLDRLINLTGELVVGQQMISNHALVLEELTQLVQHQQRELLALESELRALALRGERRGVVVQHVNTLLNTTEQTRQLLRHQSDQFGQHADHQRILVNDLEQEVMTVRLMPISHVFSRLYRAVRELSHTIGKEVTLEVRGEATEIDRKMLEALGDPLMHMVRNAIDHGIELPDERVAKGKPRQGQIYVSAEAVGDEVHVVVRDNGAGIDPHRMRTSAVQKGLISAEHAQALNDQEALELVFLPGFSTATIITDVSGRGVGMDVVRTNIVELGGQVLISSQPGEGTEVTMVLPLTLVTTRVVLIQVGAQTFALPALGCRGIILVHPEHIEIIEGRTTIVHDGRTVPLLRMADVLGINTNRPPLPQERTPALLIGSPQRLLSFLVDAVLDEREAVVKPLGPLLELQRRYTGAIQLDDAQLVLLLNPMALMQLARGIGAQRMHAETDAPDEQRQPKLLLAEDSFTTRELIRSILHSAGYQVTPATDGADALDKLRTHSYDLVITDVEMPRVDGFELTTRIRQELGLHDIPVIIITSLASDEHRRRGLEAGAQAYIVKSQFHQDTLLEVLHQLLGAP